MSTADLVLEGGGVKGTGLVGAITALTEHQDSYQFHRIAGASAGAIVASFLAAGINPVALKQIMTDQDFAQFEDEADVFSSPETVRRRVRSALPRRPVRRGHPAHVHRRSTSRSMA